MPARTEIFAARAFAPAPLQAAAFRACVLNALKETAKDAQERLQDVVSTWRHDVEFTGAIIRYSGGDAYVSISTDDDIFRWLDEGTLIRWAHMSKDFVPKTQPGGPFKSSPGRGRLRYVGKPPARGIEAREWMRRLDEELSIVLAFRIQDCLDRYFPGV